MAYDDPPIPTPVARSGVFQFFTELLYILAGSLFVIGTIHCWIMRDGLFPPDHVPMEEWRSTGISAFFKFAATFRPVLVVVIVLIGTGRLLSNAARGD